MKIVSGYYGNENETFTETKICCFVKKYSMYLFGMLFVIVMSERIKRIEKGLSNPSARHFDILFPQVQTENVYILVHDERLGLNLNKSR